MPGSRFWVQRNGKCTGPFGVRQLKQMAEAGLIEGSDLISKDQQTWQAARAVRGLLPTQPTLSAPAAQQAAVTSQADTEPGPTEAPSVKRSSGPVASPSTEARCEWFCKTCQKPVSTKWKGLLVQRARCSICGSEDLEELVALPTIEPPNSRSKSTEVPSHPKKKSIRAKLATAGLFLLVIVAGFLWRRMVNPHPYGDATSCREFAKVARELRTEILSGISVEQFEAKSTRLQDAFKLIEPQKLPGELREKAFAVLAVVMAHGAAWTTTTMTAELPQEVLKLLESQVGAPATEDELRRGLGIVVESLDDFLNEYDRWAERI